MHTCMCLPLPARACTSACSRTRARARAHTHTHTHTHTPRWLAKRDLRPHLFTHARKVLLRQASPVLLARPRHVHLDAYALALHLSATWLDYTPSSAPSKGLEPVTHARCSYLADTESTAFETERAEGETRVTSAAALLAHVLPKDLCGVC